MKKLLLFVALTASISFCTSTLNSFASSNNSTVNADASYWQGKAFANNGYVYITVYQSYGQCNSYYAEVSKWQHQVGWNKFVVDDINNEQCVVKYSEYKKKYYVTFRDVDYFFDM